MNDKSLNLMPEEVQRILGKEAQRSNIMAAKMVSEIVKTTLGPKGMDKMLVSSDNNVVVTNDGVTILNEMQVEHPVAKIMVDIAGTQENEVGDGTTTAVMIAGKLLENAEKLLDKKIHPTVVSRGYRIAAEKAQEILMDLALKVTPQDDDVLKQIAMTAMTGKGAEDAKETLSEIIVSSLRQIRENEKIDLDNLKIEMSKGSRVKDTELIKGIVFNKERVSKDMPSKVENAKIALFDFPLEVKNPELNTRISVTSPDQLHNFLADEENEIKNIVESIKSSGTNVVFCQKGIDDFAQYLLAKEGIYACRRVPKSDLEKISKAIGCRIVGNLKELNFSELGHAEIVEEIKHGEEIFTYVKGCQNPKALTILIRGGTEHVIDEVKRAIEDGLGDVNCVLKSGLIVPGGGAIEMEISKRLYEFSRSFSGREMLAIEEFASALECVPITLAENAGMDPIEIITELKSRHDAGEKNAGLNLFNGKIENVLTSRIIEPLKIKSQAISSASDVAIMILRIDDIICAGNKESSKNNKKNYIDLD